MVELVKHFNFSRNEFKTSCKKRFGLFHFIGVSCRWLVAVPKIGVGLRIGVWVITDVQIMLRTTFRNLTRITTAKSGSPTWRPVDGLR